MFARGNFSGIFAAVVFIVLEIIAAAVLAKTSTLQNVWINRASHRTLAVFWGWSEQIRDYFSLRSTNEKLAQENFELSRQLDYFRNLHPSEIENAVKSGGDGQFRYIPATIVKISRNMQHNYIILNKGSEDGITPHSGIINAYGVVGIIDAVDEHYSYGLTLMNTKVSVSARLGESGPVAVLSWDGINEDKAVMKGVPLQYETCLGDTVYTSGISDLFPGDIPLGVVKKYYLVDGASGETSVDLFQRFSSLRYVTVVSNPHRSEVEGLETGEDEQ